jgi:hypothetical protein
MPELGVYFDTDAPDGEKFVSPLVRAEIEVVAPSTLNDGDVSTVKLDDEAVTTAKLGPGAVTTSKIGAKEVKTANLADEAVDEDQLADGAVTAEKAGQGVVTVHDDGAPITLDVRFLTVAAYAALVSPDPNVFYAVY